ncbi:hypothetical protein FEM48_Zijuj09G0153000 [Ziziphus jujuba var. spinosa]|uniref:Microtubule-associated protein 70-5 n=1 Tax=Ziziphus jujuba var. spinosa TaxID=714518 RepID=A0A978UTR3_ZIZJJ|nr:hypothetical protein FEM48_Zijuj09G0153000 [Ziziphus jujuba var. spinosa]
MVSHNEEQHGVDDFSVLQPDPVVLELNRLKNLLKEKDRELGVAQGEIKGLRATEVLKDKALEELRNEVQKLDEKLGVTENLLEHKNLEIKKLTNDKKNALAAQFAAEATLRRVHANQKDDDSLPIVSVIAPLEAEIKIYKNEIATLQEDKKALERLTKSKESALLEAERILRSALERALIVEEEENRILEKTNRQKVLEVEKLSQTIHELEEAILAGGAAANAIRDYKRQIEELNEEKRTLERELARSKVSANRVATVVANEWKDENDKVMPVTAEMQRLRDKLTVSERTAKAEAQLKEKLNLRLKTLEEGLKHVSRLIKRSTSQPRASTFGKTSPLQQPNVEIETATGELKRANSFRKKYSSGENMLKRSLWATKSKVVDSEAKTKGSGNEESPNQGTTNSDSEDMVSGFLYDRLQKEVISLRKIFEVKKNHLNAKDQEIKMLMKKVEALTKSIEVETKRMKREAAAREKEAASMKMVDNKKNRTINSYNRVTKSP